MSLLESPLEGPHHDPEPLDVPTISGRRRHEPVVESGAPSDAVAAAERALDWTASALCVGKTDLFFARPGERDGRRRRREALARSYCDCCPVQRMCLLAGRLGREHGIWGGENDEERAAAGFGPRSPHRRAVAKAAREAREKLGGAQPTLLPEERSA